MKFPFKGAAILSGVVVASGYATVALTKSPPPPPEPYSPQILYTVGSKGGSTASITVSNADGTDVVSLYTSQNITGLNDVKFSTTANQIVFSEQNNIKVLTYAVSPQSGVTTTSVRTLASEPYTVLHVDVSPDGSKLLFVEHTADPNQWAVYVMSMTGGNRTPIQLVPAIYYDAVWAHSSSRIAVIQGGPVQQNYGVQTIQIIDLTTNGITPILTSTTNQLYQVSRLESAHTSDTLLFYATPSGSTATGVYTVDIGTQIVTPIVAGWSASFSSDDSRVLFRGNATGDLFTLNISANVQSQITSKVVLGRPDSLP